MLYTTPQCPDVYPDRLPPLTSPRSQGLVHCSSFAAHHQSYQLCGQEDIPFKTPQTGRYWAAQQHLCHRCTLLVRTVAHHPTVLSSRYTPTIMAVNPCAAAIAYSMQHVCQASNSTPPKMVAALVAPPARCAQDSHVAPSYSCYLAPWYATSPIQYAPQRQQQQQQ